MANFLLVLHRTYVAQHPPSLFFPFRLIPLLFFGHILFFFFFPPSPLFHTILFAYFPFLFVLVSAPAQPSPTTSPHPKPRQTWKPLLRQNIPFLLHRIMGDFRMKQLRKKSQKFFMYVGSSRRGKLRPHSGKISRFRAVFWLIIISSWGYGFL